MRHAFAASLAVLCLALVTACTMFGAGQPKAAPVQPKELSLPVGKHWKVVEEPPPLTNERNARPAFQTEQSLEPEGVQHPAAPTEEKGRSIETPR